MNKKEISLKLVKRSIIKLKEQDQEIKALESLARDLITACNTVSQEEYIIQPFLTVILKHMDTINKHDLTKEVTGE